MSGQFVDTNVLVYAFGETGDRRHAVAQSLVMTLLKQDSLVTSVQVLKELYVVTTRKLRPGLSEKQASLLVRHLTEACRVVEETVSLLERSLELSAKARISLWDASVLAGAEAAGCEQLYSEDLQNGRRLAGIRVTNPFE
jgi:predicted nucleic acid-binding protein